MPETSLDDKMNTLPATNDPRIASGMKRQLSLRREWLRAGKKPLGWKLAFGGPAAMQRLQINAPLVGCLMADAVVPSGSAISVGSWVKPAAEPELTVYLGADLLANSDRQTTMSAISALGAGIEIADVDHPSEDVEGTLAGDIYQRHLILGEPDSSRAGGGLTGLKARVFRNHELLADTTDFEALTGELIHIVTHTANLLSAFGETLRAGELIIAGSLTPPIWVAPGDTVQFHLQPLEPLSVSFH
jgi:2-keto-4-pentenoate hydratase